MYIHTCMYVYTYMYVYSYIHTHIQHLQTSGTRKKRGGGKSYKTGIPSGNGNWSSNPWPVISIASVGSTLMRFWSVPRSWKFLNDPCCCSESGTGCTLKDTGVAWNV